MNRINGDIIVSDYGDNFIKLFDASGNFKSKYGDGSLVCGVSCDRRGNIYVTDGVKIKILTSDLKLIDNISIADIGHFDQQPCCIAISRNENKLVLCNKAGFARCYTILYN